MDEQKGMHQRDIIVIGASAGGIEALIRLVELLPKDFEASIFLVVHLPPHYNSSLHKALQKKCRLTVGFAQDGERIRQKRLYIAPPDHHLILEKDTVLVKKGPKENRFRPSIDALFRSAAYNFGPRVTGIVLSGLMEDGSSGLWTIKRLGGRAIIQDPEEAIHSGMPLSALQQVEIDYILKIDEMPGVLVDILGEPVQYNASLDNTEQSRIQKEVQIAADNDSSQGDTYQIGTPASFTCPSCHGSFQQIREGNFVRYRCHTGHAFNEASLMAGINKNIEESLYSALRAMEQAIELLDNKSGDLISAGNHNEALHIEKKKESYMVNRKLVKHLLFEIEGQITV